MTDPADNILLAIDVFSALVILLFISSLIWSHRKLRAPWHLHAISWTVFAITVAPSIVRWSPLESLATAVATPYVLWVNRRSSLERERIRDEIQQMDQQLEQRLRDNDAQQENQ